MIRQITIRKTPYSYYPDIENPSSHNFKPIISNVDLDDLVEFIINISDIADRIDKPRWSVKDINDEIGLVEIYWAIYAYLITNKFLIIDHNDWRVAHGMESDYNILNDYYSQLELILFDKILNRLNKFHTEIMDNGNSKISQNYIRKRKLNHILQ